MAVGVIGGFAGGVLKIFSGWSGNDTFFGRTTFMGVPLLGTHGNREINIGGLEIEIDCNGCCHINYVGAMPVYGQLFVSRYGAYISSGV